MVPQQTEYGAAPLGFAPPDDPYGQPGVDYGTRPPTSTLRRSRIRRLRPPIRWRR